MFFTLPRQTSRYTRFLQASAGHNVTQKAHDLFTQRVAVLLGALGIALSGYSSRQLTLHHRPSARFLLWASKPAISGENLEACSGCVSVDSASDAIREDMKH